MKGPRSVTAMDRHIGHRLRTCRMMLRLNQSELGEAIGVTFQQLQKYEKGSNRVSASTLQKLAATMEVPITYFFEGVSSEKTQSDNFNKEWTEFLATSDGLALIRAFKRIDSKDLRRAVVHLVEQMGKPKY
jgi:transcriptional regulator with XRE-family HTH domain